MDVIAYPLQWPAGWKRTDTFSRSTGQFKRGKRQYATEPGAGSWLRFESATLAESVDRVLLELSRMGVPACDAVISTNIEPTLSGRPRSGGLAPVDPGAAVYWRDGRTTRCMAIDRYLSVSANLCAIAATLEAMRAIERHGGAAILDRAFQGFAALPAPTSRSWRDVLGVGPDENRLEAVTAQYRKLAATYHPDRYPGGEERMAEINVAWEKAVEALR